MRVKARRRRLPSYIGVVYWGFFLVLIGFAALNSGLWWGLTFGAIWLALLAVCLWFYGVVPIGHRTDDGRA